MVETIYMVAGWVLLVGGVLVAWWFGWRDTGKGSRRCSKCWYDMGATAGLKCPECGREAKTEKQLHRSNRRWRFVVVGLVMMLAAYPVARVPRVQKDGIAGLLPRIVILAAWPELISPKNFDSTNLSWWQYNPNAVQRVFESATLGSDLSTLETRAIVWSSIRAMKGSGPHARAAQEALRVLGPEMGADGARAIVDVWRAGKLRSRGPGYGSCVFMELPESGAAFVDEVIAAVRKDPSFLVRDPYIVEWVLAQRGTIAEIIVPLDAVLSNANVNDAGNFYVQLGTLPFPADDAARTARMFRFEKKMGNMQLSMTLPRSGAASRFIADYREALTEPGGNRISSALVGAALAGPSLSELQPEIEASLQSANEGVRFQARVALAMITDLSGDVESEVLDVIVNEKWRSMGSFGPGGRTSESERNAFARKSVAVAAMCSGAWPADVACEALIGGARDIESSEMLFVRQQAIQFILMNAEQTRKHADALNEALARNQMLAMLVGRRVRMFPAADAIAPGLERAAEASTSSFQKRVLRGQAKEARSSGRATPNP